MLVVFSLVKYLLRMFFVLRGLVALIVRLEVLVAWIKYSMFLKNGGIKI